MSALTTKKKNLALRRFMSAWGAVISLILAFIIFSCLEPEYFLTTTNMVTIIRACAITTVISMGMTFAFSANVFDLSVGSTATLGAGFSLTFMVWYGIPMIPAIILTILLCVSIGAINSVLALKFKIPAVLVTLAMQFILNGVALTYSGGSIITATREGAKGQQIVMEAPDAFFSMGKEPWIIIIMFVCVIAVAVFQTKTKHGRYLYIVGSNPEAAKLSGINVTKYRALAFMATSLFAGIGGILIVARAGTVSTTAGASFLMPSIAAVNIGISVGGVGKPNAIGTFIGALLLQVVENGLFMMSVPYYSIDIAKGIILIVALLLSNMANEK